MRVRPGPGPARLPPVIEAPSAQERYLGSERLNIAVGGKRFRCDFIEPGFVNYSDTPGLGMELLRKNAIDAALSSAVGMPLIIQHVPTTSPVPVERICGRVDKAGYDERTNWFWCEGTVDSDAARECIKKGEKTSVGFRVNQTSPGGMDHNISYTQELTGITFHHLAIVDNPRYEGANIRLNALGQKQTTAMPAFKFIKKIVRQIAGGANETVEETGELPADATIEIDGQAVRLNDLKDHHLKVEQAKAAAKAAELTGDTEVEVAPGQRVKVSVLAESYRTNAKADAAKKTADEDRKKAEKADADRAEEERKNAGAQSFRVLAGASKIPVAEVAAVTGRANTLQDRMALGNERYGGPVPGKN